ncbi:MULTISPECIES: DUF2391 domain-containing protein [Halolamina]|uniref:Integral membrane protein n=1 Tax=Halolamina pelagica TaxID=699431 RepID=A0A1I5MFK8_9EURY|nr:MULTISPECIES: DUF2391 domain-containing protein [Halolamina]NHX36003.1 DUF2391 domain-containing protein [Halolamina sp. R1-12]SFP08372.1 hypothetical protein SAMN05216277_101248 [Halolamina pelagica]
MISVPRSLLRRLFNREFRPADVAQQVVGGFLLAGPFVVTEEVWVLAGFMNGVQWAVTVAMVFTIGWGALYRADSDRDADDETEVAGIPYRFLTLMLVSFGSVLVLAFSFAAPEAFGADLSQTAKAVSIGAVFAVVGAATADSVF